MRTEILNYPSTINVFHTQKPVKEIGKKEEIVKEKTMKVQKLKKRIGKRKKIQRHKKGFLMIQEAFFVLFDQHLKTIIASYITGIANNFTSSSVMTSLHMMTKRSTTLRNSRTFPDQGRFCKYFMASASTSLEA